MALVELGNLCFSLMDKISKATDCRTSGISSSPCISSVTSSSFSFVSTCSSSGTVLLLYLMSSSDGLDFQLDVHCVCKQSFKNFWKKNLQNNGD